jgi:hypothetical protein
MASAGREGGTFKASLFRILEIRPSSMDEIIHELRFYAATLFLIQKELLVRLGD